jgi:threonylcarbamoyladenosine tRNA methylthiotransferase CDKAL1
MPIDKPKVYAQAHGCPSNTADMEISLGILRDAGFGIAALPEEADLNIIFTCTVKSSSEKRMEHLISKLAALGKPLIVAGCMPKTELRVVERLAPNASIVGPDSIRNILYAARSALGGQKAIFVKDDRLDKQGLPRVRKDPKIGVVPIASGCLSKCSYCSVRLARGKLHSYPLDAIVEEVRRLVADGCTQIQLTSEDNGCYGVDIGTNLAELVMKVSAIDGDFQIRVGMLNPTYVRDPKVLGPLIEAYNDPKVSKFVNIPVQSGSDRVLKLMRRGYTVWDFERIVERFRKDVAGIYVSTDIIVGFPGETEGDFKDTVALLERTNPDKVNLSRFCARAGTDAAKMEQLPGGTIRDRSRKIHDSIIVSRSSGRGASSP